MRTMAGQSDAGFSLVEIMISVMILGLGLVMVAGAFPVGLRAHEDSMDKTIAALLAQSAVAAVKMYRTPDAERAFVDEQDWQYFADARGQIAIVECFKSSSGVKYLFEGHSGGLLEDMLGGNDISDWLPQSERIYRPDPRYAYQIFYQRMAEPDENGAPTSSTRMFQVFVLVQKSLKGRTGTYSERFPTPSGSMSVANVNGSAQTFTLAGVAVSSTAALIDTTTGDVYKVVDVDVDGGVQTVHVDRSPRAGLAGHRVRVIPNVVAVFTSIVSKTLPG